MDLRDEVVTRAGSAIDEGLRGHMLRVYNYMTTGMLATGFVAYLLAATELLDKLFYSTSADGQYLELNWLGYAAIIAPLALVFMFGSAARKANAARAKTIFFVYSAVMGISIGLICDAYVGTSVFRTFVVTAATFGSMSLYGYTTKRSLSGLGSFLIMGLFGIIIAMVVNLFARSGTADLVISVLGVLIFTGLTAYDTQKIRALYSEGDSADARDTKAIVGALELYLDFVNLFLFLLRFLGNRK